MLVLCVILCLVRPAFAADAARATYEFELPAQSLNVSLEAVALALHQKLLYSSELVDGRTAPPLSGRFNAEQAVQQLLTGSGIGYEIGDGLIVVRAAHSAESAQAAADSLEPIKLPELEEVTVTGSRITRLDFTSSSPIATATHRTLRESGKVNIETALQQMPQFSPAEDESYNAENSGGGGRATVNLRGLGETRTLVLLDGRRMPPSNGAMVANLNDIPIGIVDSVEVISGGASAVYGSDAIAGVVNIKTRPHFNGLEINATDGAALGGYGQKNDLSVTMGSDFADAQGRALLALNWTGREQVAGSQVPFFHLGGFATTLPQFTFMPTSGNLPTQSAYDALFAQYGAPAGQVSNSTRIGLNQSGSWFSPFSPYANYQGPRNETETPPVITTSTGTLVLNTANYKLVTAPQDRYSAFSKLDYELTGHAKLYFQGLYSSDKISTQDNLQFTNAGNLTIPVTNPYVPASLLPLLASRASPTAPFQFTKRYQDLPPHRFDEYFDTLQIIVGAAGDLPALGLDWDVYGSHDSTVDTEIARHVLLSSRLENLFDAPDGGNSLCQGGFNPFQSLTSTMSSDCASYVTTDEHSVTTVRTDAAEGTLRGALGRLPAGQVRFALTANGRHVTYQYSPDPILVIGDLGVGTTRPSAGEISVREISAETLLPLLADRAYARAWNLTIAARTSHYDTAGSIGAWKLDTDWRINRAVMLRGGYEHAVRAPNITELFSSPTNVITQLGTAPAMGDPCDLRSLLRNGPNGAQIAALCVAQGIPADLIGTYTFANSSTTAVQSGSTALKPERADTFTLGTVLTSPLQTPFLANLQFSVDAYNIVIEDVIGTSGVQTVFNKCYNVDGSNPTYSATNPWCELIDRVTTGAVGLRVLQPYLNLGGYKTSGVDTQLDWTLSLADLGRGFPGKLHLTSALTWVRRFEVEQSPGAPFLDYAGTVSLPYVVIPAVPRTRLLTTLNYAVGNIDGGVRWRHIAAMRDVSVVTNAASTVPGVPAYDYFDLLAGYQLNDRIRLYGTLTNLTGKDPPIVGGSAGNTQRGLYDLLGRTYQISFNVKL